MIRPWQCRIAFLDPKATGNILFELAEMPKDGRPRINVLRTPALMLLQTRSFEDAAICCVCGGPRGFAMMAAAPSVDDFGGAQPLRSISALVGILEIVCTTVASPCRHHD